MGYIYIDKNYFTGWSSDACVGQVDSNGYVYNRMNYISGWGSGSCIGRVDEETGFVYNDKNVWSGWSSSACVGCFDKDGYIYNNKNSLTGYSSSACIGHMDSGYVYTSRNYLSGWSSDACVGKVAEIADAAALLLLILPKIKEEKKISDGIFGGGSRNSGGRNSGGWGRRTPQSGGGAAGGYGGGTSQGGNIMGELIILAVIIGILAVFKMVFSTFEAIMSFAKLFPGFYIIFVEVAVSLILIFISKQRIKKILNDEEKKQANVVGLVSAVMALLVNIFFGRYPILQIVSVAGISGIVMYVSTFVVAWCTGFALRRMIYQVFHK